tara:strand:- start:772 stop:996 length:225 start_codon:yes stop_codon:yes gene_type:complete
MLDSETIKEISEAIGQHYINATKENEFTLRFGYWRRINKIDLQFILPTHYKVEEQEVHEDEDCGILYDYLITKK